MKVVLVSVSLEFPLASYCLAAHVLVSPRLAGCTVEMLDLDWSRLSSYERKNAEIWRYLARIDALQPDVIGFSIYLWNHLAIRELVTLTSMLFPSVRLVLGGPELATTEAADDWLGACPSCVVVRGEGERSFEELLERFAQSHHTRGVLGTSAWQFEDIVHEYPRSPIRDLAELASPFLDGLVPADLFERGAAVPRPASYPRALLETYRGCYMQCSYCQWGNGSKDRFEFPKDRVKKEISWLLSQDVHAIFFVDAMFGYKKSRAVELLEHMVAEKQRLSARTRLSLYHNQDFYDPRLFDLYREAGAVVEVDLQSTNRGVLNRLGRGRWFTDSFDRHLAAFRQQGVQTTGAADLIIGIPGDTLASFQDSVDFLLRRRMRINLYQASVLPDTGWARTVESDGTTFSPLPPRAILQNGTLPLRDMISARLIGHGTDLFNSFPRTAELLWRMAFERPVDLCREIGERIFRTHGLMYGESHQYDWVIGKYLSSLADVIRDLCPDPRKVDVLLELLSFEGALAAVTWSPTTDWISPTADWQVSGETWLQERPKLQPKGVHRVKFRHNITDLTQSWPDEPGAELLEAVTPHPHAVLFFNDGQPRYLPIDLVLTDRLLQRFNGYFTVAEVIEHLGLRWQDMTPVWQILSILAANGLICPGPVDAQAEHHALRNTAVLAGIVE